MIRARCAASGGELRRASQAGGGRNSGRFACNRLLILARFPGTTHSEILRTLTVPGYRDRRKLIRSWRSVELRRFAKFGPVLLKLLITCLASPPWPLMACTRSVALPSCRKNSRCPNPQSGAVRIGSDPQALLSSDERKIATEFQKELFKTLDERGLEVRFRVLILQVQEFENERVSDVSVSRQAFVIGRRGGPCTAGSLVGETGDLSIELAGRPATPQCLALVIFACLGIGDGEQPDIVGRRQREPRPRDRSGRRCLPNSRIDQFGRHCLRIWPA